MKSLLLIAHGSRRAEANADLEYLADVLRQRERYDLVRIAFLELAEPDIPTGAIHCIEAGATQVIMVPYFLSPGVHVRTDLIEFRKTLSERYPAVDFRLAEPLGRHPLLIDIVEQRIREAEHA